MMQSRAEQSRAEQSRAEQSRAEQSTCCSKKSIYSLDIAKFCLALIVVQLHSSGYNVPFSRLAVPVFFTISGFLFFLKYDKKQQFSDKMAYLWHFLKRIIMLYMFWFIIQLPYIYMVRKPFFDNLLNGDFKLFFLMLFNSTFIGSWFLAALSVGMIVVSLLSFALSRTFLFLFCFIIFVMCQILQFDIPAPDYIRHFFDPLGYFVIQPPMSFLIALIFIAIGKAIADYNGKNIIPNKLLIVILVISAVVVLLEIIFTNQYYLFLSTIVASIPFCYALTELLIRYSPKEISPKRAEICSYLRKVSIIIYCCHGGAACLLRFILYPVFGKNAIVKACMYPLTLSVALLLAFIILTLAKKNYFKWLKIAY